MFSIIGELQNIRIAQHGSPEFLISTFIIFYVIFAWSWDLPDTHPEYRVIDLLKSVVNWLGLHHGWRMFAPDVLRVDSYLSARIQFEDGSITTWKEPVLSKMGFLKAIFYGRHRKYKYNLIGKASGATRCGFVHYIAKLPEYSEKKVKSVSLFVVTQRVAPHSAPEGTCGSVERTKLHVCDFNPN